MQLKIATTIAAAALAGWCSAATAQEQPKAQPFDQIQQTAPRSPFDQIQETAPKADPNASKSGVVGSTARAPFDQIQDSAPRAPFDQIQDTAPRSGTPAPAQKK